MDKLKFYNLYKKGTVFLLLMTVFRQNSIAYVNKKHPFD